MKKQILTEEVALKKLKRIALEVAERNFNEKELLLIGIKENGIVIAQIISKLMKAVFTGSITVVALSMNKKKPTSITIEKDIDVDGKTILLIDG